MSALVQYFGKKIVNVKNIVNIHKFIYTHICTKSYVIQ